MNKLQDADLMAKFPPALKNDKSMLALGQLIAGELHITANEIKKNIIYANIDGLPETWLDVLAYDMHIDWYDYDYPVDVKKKLIKNSVKIHQKSGTKYAVEKALADVYKTATVKEWFEYGGEPYHFQVKVNIANVGMTEETTSQIRQKMLFYKNLRSHCDGIFYEIRVAHAEVKAAGVSEVGAKLKIKPLLKRMIKAAGQNDIRAATLFRAELKVRPQLSGGIYRC